MPSKQWSATEMPRYRRDLVSALEQLSRDDEQIAAFGTQAASRAELFWVTPDMTAAAWDASADLPDWIPAHAAPCDAGLLLWGKPLPGLSPDAYASGGRELDEHPISGIYWRRTGTKFYLAIIARTEHLPPNHRPASNWQILPDEILGIPADPPVCLGEVSRASGLFAMIGATWMMMQQPGVGATHTITGAGGSSRSWTREERAVVLVDLRPPVDRSTITADNPTSRTYTHRWMVRGHWKQQPYGLGRVLRRPTWIASYIAGPHDKPLLVKDVVWQWRR